jgi:anaerobic selenocysteine-containing dehydrogenase
VDGMVSAGVVRIPAVGWGQNGNALTPERLTDMGGGPSFYSCLVQVERCGD